MTTLASLYNTYMSSCQTLLTNSNNQINAINKLPISGYQKKQQTAIVINNFNIQIANYYSNYQNAVNLYNQAQSHVPAPTPAPAPAPTPAAPATTPASASASSLTSNKKALLIGTNYPYTPYTLHGCVNDPNDLKAVLVKRGFQNANITLLTDDTALKPTKVNIINAITTLLTKAVSGDILFLSFSGHGSQTYIGNVDEEMIVTSDLEYITDIELNPLVENNLKANVSLFVLFDSCHSGTMLDLKYQYTDYKNQTIYPNNKTTLGNLVYVSGCRDDQTSAEDFLSGKYQGALTYAFVENFGNAKSGTYTSLLTNIRSLLQSAGYDQVPQLSSGEPLNTGSALFIL